MRKPIKALRGFESGVHTVSRLVSWVGRLTLGVIAFLLTADVIMRGVFDRVIVGTIDMVGLLNVVLATCCIAYTASDRSHIAIASITTRFSPRNRTIIRSIGFFFGMGFAGLVSWYMLLRAADAYSLLVGPKTSMLEIPHAPFILLGAVGFFLLALEFLVSFSELMRYVVENRKDETQPAEKVEGAI